MSSSTQAFDDPGGDDGFFKLESNSVTNYINWYKQPPPNADNAQSIHDWQQQFRHPRDARVYLVFKNPSRTGNQNDRLRANQNGYTVSFVIIGGTTYPRFSLRLGLVHPSNDRFQNVSLRLVFPVYGDDGLNQPRDRLTVTPGRAIENGLTNSLSPDKAFTLSNSMINLAYERIVISKEQSQVSGLKEGANSEMISWQTDIEPISSNFNVNLAALGFTAEQCAVAATFRKLKAPETTIWVRTTIPSNLDWQFKLVTAMPSPCLPPFPLIDARYNPGLKCLKPIHVGNIPSITSEDAAQVRFHLGLRKKGWNKPNGYTGSLVSGPQEKKIISMEYSKFFDGKRHYEAVQILGLAREIQAQRPDAASLFNRQYAFLLSPVPNSFDDSEFVIFLNVRPTHRDRFDATMAPPEPGCAVSITMEQGTQPEPEPSQFRRIHSRAASNASQQRPHASSSASQRSHTRNVSSMSGPAGGPASPASIAQRSHLRNVSNTSVLGGAVSPPGTPPHWDIGSPVRSQPGTPTRVSPSQSRRISDLPLPNISALALSSNVPGDISTWYGPSINRSADMVTWNGFVVPNPSKNRDDFDICIWLRIPSAAEPMGGLVTDIKSGHFKFGITNTGAYVQQEQAIRLAMHGDMSFYGIPPNNWMQDLLLGLENQSLKDQGRGITLKDGPRMHSSFQNKLTNQQKRALQAAVTNNEAKRQKANHYAVLLKGPPGTGKSTVSQCIAYHCYMFGEALLVACGTNRALDSVANKILEILPKSGSQWTVPNSVKNVYRLETDFDESYEQVSRNGQAYSHTFSGDYEPRSYQIDLSQYRDAPIDDNNFRYLEEYVKRRATTNRPLSLGDHILQRLRKARAQRLRAQWTFDEYPPEESKREYDLLNDFIGLRHAAARQNVFYVEIIGETAPQRRARFEELDDTQKFITKETAKAWRNLQTFYIKHARIILITAQTAGRRIMKGFRASRVIIEEAGQLDEPNSLNAFVRSYSTLRKVIWSGGKSHDLLSLFMVLP